MGIRSLLAILLALGVQAPPAPAPSLASATAEPDDASIVRLFEGGSLDEWNVPAKGRDRVGVVGDVLQVRGRSTRLVSRRTFDDFVLTFEARQVDADSRGGVMVRMLLPPPATPSSVHRAAFEVPVATGKTQVAPLLIHIGDAVAPGVAPTGSPVPPDTEWHRYRVECTGDRIRVRRDDAELLNVAGVYLNTGPVALHADRGRIEFRRIELRTLDPPPAPSVYRSDDWATRGVVPPRLRRDAKPQYTPNALRAGIQGTATLDCVVARTGRMDQCRVIRRVATELDAKALAAAMAWEFEPATLQGEPVAVLVTIEMAFNLK